jgi:hypothetical protein
MTGNEGQKTKHWAGGSNFGGICQLGQISFRKFNGASSNRTSAAVATAWSL